MKKIKFGRDWNQDGEVTRLIESLRARKAAEKQARLNLRKKSKQPDSNAYKRIHSKPAEDGYRYCSWLQHWLPVNNFNMGTGYCKVCFNEYQKHRNLCRRFDKLTIDGYQSMLEEQNLSCAMCLQLGKILLVDYDEETKKPIGLVCRWCYMGVCRARANLDWGQAALDYLQRSIDKSKQLKDGYVSN